MATLGTEESGCCKQVAVVERFFKNKRLFKNNSQCMDLLSAGTKKSGHCREVAISSGSTVMRS